MTAKRNVLDEDQGLIDWIRRGAAPLTLDQQLALIKDADDSYARGNSHTEEEADRLIDAIIARHATG